jgi:hypothetical protein
VGVADRKEPRFPVDLPVLLKIGGRGVERHTRDVSFAGIFVCTEPAPEGAAPVSELALRQLVGITILLPPHAKRIDVAATVVHRQRQPGRAGVGLRFYGMAGDDLRSWEQFVARLRDDFPPMTGRATRLLQGEHVDPLVRRRPDQVAALRVAVQTVAELERMLELDPKAPTFFVLCDEQLEVGAELGVWLVHPESEDLFELACRIERVVHEHGIRGLGLVLVDFDEERRQRFREFVEDGLEALFDDEDLFDEELSSPPPATVRIDDPHAYVAAQEAAALAADDEREPR